MKRSWLIGAALLFSLSAVACSDDDEDETPVTNPDGGRDGGGGSTIVDGGGLDSGLDATTPAADAGDAG
jgi:hypothetical protein